MDVSDFLNKFADINIRVGHMKEGSITFEQQSRIYDYVRKSIEIVQKLNRAYCYLVETGVYPGPGKGELFFSFCQLKDRQGLKPIFVDTQTATRLLDRLTSKKYIEISLEDWYHIEQYFSSQYPVFLGVIARLIRQNDEEMLRTLHRIRIQHNNGCVISLSASQVKPVRTKQGLRFFSDEEVQQYLEELQNKPRDTSI